MIHRCPGCGASMRYARNVSVAEEAEANRNAPAAILDCTACPDRMVVEGTNRHRPNAPPDLSVFDVALPKG